MNTTTSWLQDDHSKQYPALKGDCTVDVAVIGGGIAGITTAYLLSKKYKGTGKTVLLIDKGTLETTTTAYTTAFITYVLDTSYSDLVKMFGKEKATDVYISGKEAIDDIETIINEEKIDCDFKRVTEYLYATTDSEWKGLEDEAQTAKDLGIATTLSKEHEMPIKNNGVLAFLNQAKFHPLKYASALKEIIEKNGGLVYDHTTAEDIIEDIDSKDDAHKIHVKTSSGIITATDVIQATYQPFKNPLSLFAHKGMYVSYVMELDIPRNTLDEALYIDQRNPYHYIRIDKKNGRDRMIVGGEDHRQEIPIDPEKNFHAVESYVKEVLPELQYTVHRKWSGPILEPIDGLPFIGRYSKTNRHLYVITGFSGNGMHYSMVAGHIISDLIEGKENPYTTLYDPLRDMSAYNILKKGVDYVEEFIGGAAKNIFGDKN